MLVAFAAVSAHEKVSVGGVRCISMRTAVGLFAGVGGKARARAIVYTGMSPCAGRSGYSPSQAADDIRSWTTERLVIQDR